MTDRPTQIHSIKSPCAVFRLKKKEYCTGAFPYDLKPNSIHFYRGLVSL